MTMTAAELVASKKHILLDFDGPICAAFAGYGATNISRQLAMLIAMDGIDVPTKLGDSSDPFELLRYAAAEGDIDVLNEVDTELRRLEVQAVRIAPPTPEANAAISMLTSAGHTVTVVSNNCTEAIEIYCRAHNLSPLIATISARTQSEPTLLKPNPYLLLKAMEMHGSKPLDCVMIGDSGSDIQAAHHAEISSVAFINKASKRSSLEAARPDAFVTSMADLVQ